MPRSRFPCLGETCSYHKDVDCKTLYDYSLQDLKCLAECSSLKCVHVNAGVEGRGASGAARGCNSLHTRAA